MSRLRGEGTVTAEGQTYRLRFDMNVLADLQERTGKNASAIMEELQADGGSIQMLRVVCHEMLQRHHPGASIGIAGDILSEDVAGVMAVIQAAMPTTPAADPGNGGAKAGL